MLQPRTAAGLLLQQQRLLVLQKAGRRLSAAAARASSSSTPLSSDTTEEESFPPPATAPAVPDAAAAKERRAIEPPDVRKLAKMAQLRVSDEDVERLEPEIRRITAWFDQLQEVDLEGVPPFSELSPQGGGTLREDVPVVFDNREALVEAFPEAEGPFVKVPKIT